MPRHLAPPASRSRSLAALVLAATLGTAGVAGAQDDGTAATIARRALAAAGGVKPGETVVIVGGTHTIPYMEAVAAAVVRAGGSPLMELTSEAVQRTFVREMPVAHMRAADQAGTGMLGAMLGRADVMISFPGSADPDALNAEFSADTARMGALMKAFTTNQVAYDRTRNESRTRFVVVNYPPTKGNVRRSGMDAEGFGRMMLDAVSADQAAITRSGAAVARLLERGREMRITTPAGTDLRVPLLTGRKAALNTGVVPPNAATARLAAMRSASLPGGQVSIAPNEAAVSGTVVVPREECPDAPVRNARFTVKAGRVGGFTAEEGGKCFAEMLATGGPQIAGFSYVLIGLNPALKPNAESGYLPWSGAGVVHVGVGNNKDLGGTNGAPSSFGVALLDATVTIDGTTVVRGGQLVDVTTSSR
jgi:leucyl aminopeptidase (aminopeptidase T)